MVLLQLAAGGSERLSRGNLRCPGHVKSPPASRRRNSPNGEFPTCHASERSGTLPMAAPVISLERRATARGDPVASREAAGGSVGRLARATVAVGSTVPPSHWLTSVQSDPGSNPGAAHHSIRAEQETAAGMVALSGRTEGSKTMRVTVTTMATNNFETGIFPGGPR